MNTHNALLAEYLSGHHFDEAVDSSGAVRPHYQAIIERFGAMTIEELGRAAAMLESAFVNQGITFTVYADGAGTERTFPIDVIPRIIPHDEWAMVEAGLLQRTTALNAFLDDIYGGDEAIINDGVIPRRLVHSSTGYRREAVGLPAPTGARIAVAGVDIIRDINGTYMVLEDNLRSPSGVSYVVENRQAMTRLLPGLFSADAVRPVDHYGTMLSTALKATAPAQAGDSPNVVVLTPGVYNSAYFEHVFLATQMGVPLVEGRDLVVDNHVVYLRTTGGLSRVDVIYRRIDDDFLDPVVFRPDSSLGVAGLVNAVRAGNVTVANAIGNGVADDKAVYAFVPAMIEYYLGERAILPNVETLLLWDEDHRADALSRLEELVVKPVAEAGGYGLVIGPHATAAEIAEVRKLIIANPRNYIAQPVIDLSVMPCVLDGGIDNRHLDFRPFIVTGDTAEVLPGGLTRVALKKGSLVVNSSQGGGSKDTWVLAAPNPQGAE